MTFGLDPAFKISGEKPNVQRGWSGAGGAGNYLLKLLISD